ncbi:MAG: 6-phosphofructokinase [Spirochaetota bacterium]|nr:MAG: 6-phosphofructokinase [Spirochaetota bacterium]
MKSIGVLTSGGDSAGMNAAIRAVVKTAFSYNLKVFGIRRGYEGLIEGDIVPLDYDSVTGIHREGGTIIFSARSEEFYKPEGRKKAMDNLRSNGIEGLITIGGDGTFQGAHKLYQEYSFPVVGVPGTIDNDIGGTEYTIGYDTACNIALDAIDKIRDTARSHGRVFLVEVMGRHAGYIALDTGIAAGAEDILIPEITTDVSKVAQTLSEGIKKGWRCAIVVVAEGDDAGGAFKISKELKEKVGKDIRVTILGHIQRGGSPTAIDRINASRLGVAAVDMLVSDQTDIMVGIVSGEVVPTRLDKTWTQKKGVDTNLIRIAKLLSS